MLVVSVSVPCICPVSGLILQSNWFPPSHEAASSLITLAGVGCFTGESSRFLRFPLAKKSAPSAPILLGSLL
ncbi:hypothetical protein XENTR_v10023209 [Xenopus tropicalis]|nr:hypothetical protein XENTR_v10023209 [Xenopus tropicalis]